VHLTRRQKEILDFLTRHIERKGYAPTIEEIGEHFGLSSLATVHKHLTNLQEKGLIKRAWNRRRARPSSSPKTWWAAATPTCCRSRATP
jgi:repressor LexA